MNEEVVMEKESNEVEELKIKLEVSQEAIENMQREIQTLESDIRLLKETIIRQSMKQMGVI